jgi:hypothetical protein
LPPSPCSSSCCRKTVEKSIDASFERKKKETELLLGRQSTFHDGVLSDRYTLIGGLLARLERVSTNLNRLRSEAPVVDGFKRGNEIVPLTEVYEDLEIHWLVLGDRYHELFHRLADTTLALANTTSETEWSRLVQERSGLRKQLRELADADFRVSATSLHVSETAQQPVDADGASRRR